MDGIVIINKPKNITSFDVVSSIRRIFQVKRVGHSGTLDPMATGVLPIFIGKATRAVDFAMSEDKEYIADILFGYATDTQDITGTEISRCDKRVAFADIQGIINNFVGEQEQLPPMYSAIKINGERLYKLARAGISVDRKTRRIHINSIDILSFNEAEQVLQLRVRCSKGTYIRTLCHDIGIMLGTYAVMSGLVRTETGIFNIDSSVTLDDLKAMTDPGECLMCVDTVLFRYDSVCVDDVGRDRCLKGAFVFSANVINIPNVADKILRVYHNGCFLMLGITRMLENGTMGLFVHKLFV